MVIPQVLEVFFKGCKNFGVDEVVLCVVQDKVGHPGLFIAFQSDGFSGLFGVFSSMGFCSLAPFHRSYPDAGKVGQTLSQKPQLMHFPTSS